MNLSQISKDKLVPLNILHWKFLQYCMFVQATVFIVFVCSFLAMDCTMMVEDVISKSSVKKYL